MAETKIKCISYVHVGDELVETSKLSEAQRRQMATWLKTTYLNGLFTGQAVFRQVE